jgi:hypothetical protein
VQLNKTKRVWKITFFAQFELWFVVARKRRGWTNCLPEEITLKILRELNLVDENRGVSQLKSMNSW